MALELAFDAFGDAGDPLVILHGLLGSARNWSTLARQLGATHRVFALDLRNHGRSPWAESMSFDEMAGDVAAFIARHAAGRAAVIGHSLGGKVAMWLALTRPERVDRLIAADIAPVGYARGFGAYVAALAAVDLATARSRTDVDRQLAGTIADPALRGFLLQNLTRSEAGLAWRVNLAALAANMAALMGFPDAAGRRYPGPALFLRGGHSDYVVPEHRAAITALFPAAAHAEIADAGHWLHAERPEAFLAEVRRFLAAA